MRSKASSTNHQKNVEDTFNEARIINANSFLGMDYLESSQRENTSEYSMGPFMTDLSLSSRTYDGFVEGYYFHYPSQNTDDQYLTHIYIRCGKDYHVFGIYLGDALEKATETLKGYGYKKGKKSESERYFDNIPRTVVECPFYKGDVVITIVIEPETEEIVGIDISTKSTSYDRYTREGVML